ncbi:MAG: HigA family addiction module antitoxin [Rhodospirillaceae bacterium]|nr:HigA family addiction module antitoxin [Rhodospirillaceae bacterium]
MSKSAITMMNRRPARVAARKVARGPKAFVPVHPGEVILRDYLEPLALSQYALAKALDITQARLGEIVRGKRAISPDTALRLARYFGTSAEFWLGMQAHYDLECARDAALAEIERTVRPRAA